jgi:hypothetical protein
MYAEVPVRGGKSLARTYEEEVDAVGVRQSGPHFSSISLVWNVSAHEVAIEPERDSPVPAVVFCTPRRSTPLRYCRV